MAIRPRCGGASASGEARTGGGRGRPLRRPARAARDHRGIVPAGALYDDQAGRLLHAGAMELNHYNLKHRHREVRDAFPPALALRTHRALSWLERAEQETDDPDARFIFLWIAFNAAYANEIGDRKTFTERRVLLNFLKRLEQLDRQRLLYKAVWDQYAGPIRLLIDNKFLFQPFWDHHNRHAGAEDWQERFARSRRQAHKALGRQDTLKILAVVFDRLYVLRNQLVHGGATWNSAVNRQQIRDGAAILGTLVPIVIHLMLEAPEQIWGEPSYPVVE